MSSNPNILLFDDDIFDLNEDEPNAYIQGEVDRRHFDPLFETPEALQERKYKPVGVAVEMSPLGDPKRTRQSTTRRYRYGARTRHRDGRLSFVEFDLAPPKEPARSLSDLYNGTRQLLVTYRHSNNSLRNHDHLDLFESDKEFESFITMMELSKSRVANVLLQSFLNEDTLSFPISSIDEKDLCSSCIKNEAGVYFGLLTDAQHQLVGLYVGRSHSLSARQLNHDLTLATLMYEHDDAGQIEAMVYQKAARHIRAGGHFYFVVANVIEDYQEMSTICAQLEAFWCALFGTYRLDHALNLQRPKYGLLRPSFFGLNSTPCLEPPRAICTVPSARANTTLTTLYGQLRNIFIRYAHAAKRVGKTEDDRDDLQEHCADLFQRYKEMHQQYLDEVGRLLFNGEYQVRYFRARHQKGAYQEFPWIASNLGCRTLPRRIATRLLETENVDNASRQSLVVCVRAVVASAEHKDDLFPSTCPRLRPYFRGIRLLLGSSGIPLQYHRIMQWTPSLYSFGLVILRCLGLPLPPLDILECGAAQRDEAAWNLEHGLMPLSTWGDIVTAIPWRGHNGIRLAVTRASREQVGLQGVIEGCVFLRLNMNTSRPLWRGTGLEPHEEAILKNAGLDILPYGFSWTSIDVIFRAKTGRKFTEIALQAARSFQPFASRTPQVFDGPASFEGIDVPRIFKPQGRTLSVVRSADKPPHFLLDGRRTPQIGLPINLIRSWYPDLKYRKGTRFSVQVEGIAAETRDSVRIWVRLEAAGARQGEWLDLLSFSQRRRLSDAAWAYIRAQQAMDRRGEA